MEILKNVKDENLKAEIEKILALNEKLRSQNDLLVKQSTSNESKNDAVTPTKPSFFNLPKLSTSQSSTVVENLRNENNSLKEKILNIETQFQLQNKTLSDECLRLTKELNITQKKINSNYLKSVSIQTCINSSNAEVQTDPSDLYSDHLTMDELSPRSPFDRIKELESENIRLKKSNDKSKRDYQRQLALMKKKLTSSTNNSTTNLSSPQTQLNSPTEISSLNNINSNTDNVSEHGSTCSYSQSSITDFDFKAVMDKLAQCQDENSVLKRILQEKESDLHAKSVIIQNNLLPNAIGNKEIPQPILSGSSLKSKTNKANAKQIMSDFSALKNLCEELMMKNVTLTESLEKALSFKNTD